MGSAGLGVSLIRCLRTTSRRCAEGGVEADTVMDPGAAKPDKVLGMLREETQASRKKRVTVMWPYGQ